MQKKSHRKSHKKMKAGDCGCNADHAIGSHMSGGSGFLNPATFSSSSVPAYSYYQYNNATGNGADPITTGVNGNLISARNLPNMSSIGGKRRIKKSKKGGNVYTHSSDLKALDYVMDKSPYIPAYSGGKKMKKIKKTKKSKTSKRKSKKNKKGGNLTYSLFNQMSNPITSIGTTNGAYNSASIVTGNGQLGDNAVYNQPILSNGYSPSNPYLI